MKNVYLSYLLQQALDQALASVQSYNLDEINGNKPSKDRLENRLHMQMACIL